MSPWDRELVLKFCNGEAGLPPYAFHIYHHRRHAEIFRWLIMHGYVGKQFLSWLQEKHDRSVLKTIAYVLKWIDKEKEARPIIAGRDWAVWNARY